MNNGTDTFLEEPCLHEYIVHLGKNRETGEDYDYCLICGSRLEKNVFHSFYVEATYYLEEYKIENDSERTQKIMELRKQFSDFMLENGATSPAFVIDDFRDVVESKRNQMFQIK